MLWATTLPFVAATRSPATLTIPALQQVVAAEYNLQLVDRKRVRNSTCSETWQLLRFPPLGLLVLVPGQRFAQDGERLSYLLLQINV
jgi:hypothetical protein